MIQKGSKIRIKNNLAEVMKALGMEAETIVSFCGTFMGTQRIAYDIWKDGAQEYVTVDLCCEMPIQCCEEVEV